MLTSFFGKSRPLNFLLAGIYIFVISGAQYLSEFDGAFNSKEILSVAGVAGLLIFSMLLLDFIIRKNGLTRLNSYAILIFSCTAMILSGLTNGFMIVIANVLILLALRRIFSLQSFMNNERKILDASLWIILASAFYFWSLLLFVPLFITIMLSPYKSVRYFLIPVVGFAGMFLMMMAFHFLKDDSLVWLYEWREGISFDFSRYEPMKILIFITFISATLIWTVISKLATLSSAAKKARPNQVLVLCILGITIFLVLISSEKTGAEFLFILAPTAIIISGYIEKKTEIWFREILLWIFVLLPVLFIFL